MDLKTAQLTKHTKLTTDVFELEFEAPNFIHKAGQFITIKIPQPEGSPLLMRSYSISSKPEQGHFELCIKAIENGKGSNYLSALKEGEKIEFLGPLGHFTFKTSQDKKALFIGTGTGIAPLKSIIEDELEKSSPQPMHLIFGVRYENDIFYAEELDNLAKLHPNFTYDITISRPESTNTEYASKTGRVTSILETTKIDPQNTEAYICGLKEMVLDVTTLLKEKGLPEEAINFERFN